MRSPRYVFVAVLAIVLVLAAQPPVPAQTGSTPTIAQFLSSASPIEVVAARNVDRIAWIAYDEGKRNVYTAAAPAFAPKRLTSYLKDDGVELTGVRISADGSTVVFVRGSAANRAGWHANPASDPNGPDEAIWAGRTANPGASWRVVEGSSPQLSPDGRWVLFVKDGQIYRAAVTPVKPATGMDRGEKPFINQFGTNSNPVWSPDGTRIACVSNRGDHSFVTVYHTKTRTLTYLAPSVDFDTNPVWSSDSQRVVFTRRPGTPFGQQSQAGGGGIGMPPGPAYQQAATAGRGAAGGQGQGRGGRGSAAATTGSQTAPGGQPGQSPQAVAAPTPSPAAPVPGMMRATFKGGYTQSIWVADAASGEGREVWHNQPDDRLFATVNNIRWAGGYIVFPLTVGGGRGGRGSAPSSTEAQTPPAGPQDEWDRYYSLDVTKAHATPVLLTTTDGIIEDQTSAVVSQDGTTFFFAAGVDYAGVHLYGSSVDPNDLSYQSSAISQIDTWTSPVLLIQGDDDRNVAFSQTVGLVQLLRQRDVYTELIVFPDDVHDSLLHSRWLYLLGRMDAFLQKFLGEGAARKTTRGGQ